MSQNSSTDEGSDFLSPESGITNRVFSRFGLTQTFWRRVLRSLLLILVTWVPLVVLASFSGQASGHTVAVSLLRDPEVNCRFLVALPLLSLVEVFVLTSLAIQVRQFLTSGILADAEKARFEAIRQQVRRWHQAVGTEVALMVLSLVLSLVLRRFVFTDAASSWERKSNVISPAGWWHLLVSLPILYFFLMRALLMFFLWGWFLFRTSRLELRLTPTHPDRAGGLGFLGWGLASFGPTVLAFSAVVSAGFAYEIYHRGESLQSLKYHLIIYVLLITAVIHLPVLTLLGQLTRTRLRGLLEFTNLAWKHDRSFDEKWIHQPQSKNSEKILGSPDVLSLASMATGYEHINNMRVVPFDARAASIIALAAVVPLLPLIGTEIPFPEIIARLGEFLI